MYVNSNMANSIGSVAFKLAARCEVTESALFLLELRDPVQRCEEDECSEKRRFSL
jgi:hypothetical protein